MLERERRPVHDRRRRCRRGFNFPDDVDVWLRLSWDLTQHSRGAHFMEAVARLQPGITSSRRRASWRRSADASAREFPQTNRGWLAPPVPLLDDMLGYYRPALFVLLGAVGLVLAHRVPQRRRPAAGARDRAGAGDGGARGARRVARPAGPADARRKPAARRRPAPRPARLGALALLKLGIAALPASVPRLAQTSIDLRLLGFALAVVAATALLFGLLPALVMPRARRRRRR